MIEALTFPTSRTPLLQQLELVIILVQRNQNWQTAQQKLLMKLTCSQVPNPLIFACIKLLCSLRIALNHGNFIHEYTFYTMFRLLLYSLLCGTFVSKISGVIEISELYWQLPIQCLTRYTESVTSNIKHVQEDQR